MDDPRSTFVFRERWGTVDWKAVKDIRLQDVVQESQVEKLQLSMEYLLFVRKIDAQEMDDMEIEMEDAQRNLNETKASMKQLRQKYKRVQNLDQDVINRYETTLQTCLTTLSFQGSTASSLNSVREMLTKATCGSFQALNGESDGKDGHSKLSMAHVCSFCGKAFASKDYLQSHKNRRHGDEHSAEQKVVQARSPTQGGKDDSSVREHENKLRTVAEQEAHKLRMLATTLEMKSGIAQELQAERVRLKEAIQDEQRSLDRMIAQKLSIRTELTQLQRQITDQNAALSKAQQELEAKTSAAIREENSRILDLESELEKSTRNSAILLQEARNQTESYKKRLVEMEENVVRLKNEHLEREMEWRDANQRREENEEKRIALIKSNFEMRIEDQKDRIGLCERQIVSKEKEIQQLQRTVDSTLAEEHTRGIENRVGGEFVDTGVQTETLVQQNKDVQVDIVEKVRTEVFHVGVATPRVETQHQGTSCELLVSSTKDAIPDSKVVVVEDHVQQIAAPESFTNTVEGHVTERCPTPPKTESHHASNTSVAKQQISTILSPSGADLAVCPLPKQPVDGEKFDIEPRRRSVYDMQRDLHNQEVQDIVQSICDRMDRNLRGDCFFEMYESTRQSLEPKRSSLPRKPYLLSVYDHNDQHIKQMMHSVRGTVQEKCVAYGVHPESNSVSDQQAQSMRLALMGHFEVLSEKELRRMLQIDTKANNLVDTQSMKEEHSRRKSMETLRRTVFEEGRHQMSLIESVLHDTEDKSLASTHEYPSQTLLKSRKNEVKSPKKTVRSSFPNLKWREKTLKETFTKDNFPKLNPQPTLGLGLGVEKDSDEIHVVSINKRTTECVESTLKTSFNSVGSKQSEKRDGNSCEITNREINEYGGRSTNSSKISFQSPLNSVERSCKVRNESPSIESIESNKSREIPKIGVENEPSNLQLSVPLQVKHNESSSAKCTAAAQENTSTTKVNPPRTIQVDRKVSSNEPVVVTNEEPTDPPLRAGLQQLIENKEPNNSDAVDTSRNARDVDEGFTQEQSFRTVSEIEELELERKEIGIDEVEGEQNPKNEADFERAERVQPGVASKNSETESKMESETESKIESKTESKIESKKKSKMESKTKSKMESKIESQMESIMKPKVERSAPNDENEVFETAGSGKTSSTKPMSAQDMEVEEFDEIEELYLT